jgi:hypothetical protein
MNQLHTVDTRAVLIARLHVARAELRPADAAIATPVAAREPVSLLAPTSEATPPVPRFTRENGSLGAATPQSAAVLIHPWVPVVVELLFSAFGEQRVAGVLRFGCQNMSVIEILYAVFRGYLPK